MGSADLIAWAQSQLGVEESPAGSNSIKYNTAYYGGAVSGSQYPWCCAFIWWLFQQADASELFYGGKKTASCGTLAAYGKTHQLWIDGDYRPGDLVFFHFGGSTIVHIGMVEQIRPDGKLLTIEGNTGTLSDDNGGAVMRRIRSLSLVAGGYRPAYDDQEDDDVIRYRLLQDVPQVFQGTLELLIEAGILQGTGTDLATQSPIIDLTYEQTRTLVMVYRGGGFDAKLAQEGLPPAVVGN